MAPAQRGRGGRVTMTLAHLSFAGAVVFSAAGASVQDPASGQDAAIAEIQARIARLETELDRVGRERAGVVREFESADIQLTLRRQQLAVLERRAQLLEQERQRQTESADELRQRLVLLRRELRNRAVALYRIGPLSYARLLLSAAGPDQVLVGYQLATYIAGRDRDLVAEGRRRIDELETVLGQLVATGRQLEAVSADTRAATAALEAQQQQRRQALVRFDREAEVHRASIAAAGRAAGDLERTVGALGDVSQPSTPARMVAFADARGRLPWPVDGDVVGAFGERRHPVYDTVTVSHGVEIAAAAGDPVTAVFSGRVGFADWYSGYGLLVIIDHGGAYFTLYGHLESTEVRVGQSVEANQIVGRAGDTGSLTGTNLYFEVREGTDALNPLRWLEQRPRRRP